MARHISLILQSYQRQDPTRAVSSAMNENERRLQLTRISVQRYKRMLAIGKWFLVSTELENVRVDG